MLKAGRWAAREHPDSAGPEAWTRDLAITYVAAVDRLTIGELAARTERLASQKVGKPLTPKAKMHHIAAMSAFFRDCQEWGWLPRRFDPRRCFAVPRSIRALTGPDPRVLADDIWAKLLWAGLNFTEGDLPRAFTPATAIPWPWFERWRWCGCSPASAPTRFAGCEWAACAGKMVLASLEPRRPLRRSPACLMSP